VFFTLVVIGLVIAAVMVLPGLLQKSDYEQGRDSGMQCVRNLRAQSQLGILTEPVLQLGDELFGKIGYPYPENKSVDWQAGFRTGLRDELRRP
jgi:hypothetical protein